MAQATSSWDYESESDVNLNLQAPEIKKEIEFAVSSVEVSTKVPSTSDLVYFNIETQEKVKYCVELSLKGFRIVSNEFDFVAGGENTNRFHETIYSLLDSVSPLYTATFARVLHMKLEEMLEKRQISDQDDSN